MCKCDRSKIWEFSKKWAPEIINPLLIAILWVPFYFFLNALLTSLGGSELLSTWKEALLGVISIEVIYCILDVKFIYLVLILIASISFLYLQIPGLPPPPLPSLLH